MNYLSFYRWLPLFGCAVLACSASAAVAQDNAGSSAGVEKFDGGKFPGYVMDEVVVPVPSEIFAVLDKLGSPNWKEEIRKVRIPQTTNQQELALSFGVIVAEGFVAVQAQDKQTVQDIGREVINLAKRLALSKAVTSHANSILNAVNADDWKAVRKELDLTQATVRSEMDRMKSGDLAQCVSLGGWLRGTASVTSVVNKNYTEDRAELLNQPMLVEHFSKAIGGMSPTARKHDVIAAMNKGLTKIRKDMDNAGGTFPLDKVRSIQNTCEDLLNQIMQGKKESK
jgi:hypothetical protein